MKFEKKETLNGEIVLTASSRFLFWHIKRQYETQREYQKGYWQWLELPNRTRVPMGLSFQLDSWNKLDI